MTTKDEALRQAREALQNSSGYLGAYSTQSDLAKVLLEYNMQAIASIDDALSEKAEAVAEVSGKHGDLHIKFLPAGRDLQLGDKLYTYPTQQPDAQGKPVAWIPDDALEQLKPPMLRLLNVPLITYAAYGHSPICLSKKPQATREPTADDENDECRAAGCIASECHSMGCRVERKPDALKLLDQAEKCISAAVRIEQVYPDEPPMPVGEWDYGADQLAAEIREFLAAQQPAPQPVEPAFFINPKIINPQSGKIQVNGAITHSDRAVGGWTLPVYIAAPQPADERGAFEAWAKEAGFCIDRDESDDKYRHYHKATTRWAWMAWQARAALSQAPQAREWRELTDHEVDTIWKGHIHRDSRYRAISAAMKANNHGGDHA